MTLLIPFGAKLAWDRRRAGGEPARDSWDMLLWWCLGMFLVLNIAGSEDNQYLLPLLPPLAVLAGLFVEHTWLGLRAPRLALPVLWMFGAASCAAVVAVPLLPWLMRGAFSPWDAAACAGAALAGACALAALARGNARLFWMRMAGLSILAGILLGLYAEPELNRQKSGRPLIAELDRLVPRSALFAGYDLNENTEGMLEFYGWRPRIVIVSTNAAGDLAAAPRPAYMAIMSKSESHETAESLILSGDWRMVEKIPAGGRFYWILANRAAAGQHRGE